MDNKTVANILNELGVMIELTGGNPFSARAHYNGARIVETMTQSVASLAATNELGGVKGIGKGLLEKITELVTKGSIEEYDRLKSKIPEGLFDILRIPGVGTKKVRAVYKKMDITTLGELEYACMENRLKDLDGFGQKTQENILSGIRFLKLSREMHLFHEAKSAADTLIEQVKNIPGIDQVYITGNLRRKKETIKDIDLLASSPNSEQKEIMDAFTSLPDVTEIIGKDNTKSSVRLNSGFSADLRIVSQKEFPYALHHFTGSKEHNTAMRSRAKELGFKMNEYGIFSDDKLIDCSDETMIFKTLGMEYIEPELRENLGEIEAAEANDLPVLIEPNDIKGILHVHTIYSDGRKSIEEMVKACMGYGYEYLGICDHSRSAFYANGLSEERVQKQHDEIDSLNDKYSNFTLFKGIESDILVDGSLDYPDSVLESFDFVIASVHSKLKMSEDEANERLGRAVTNPYTTILGHPTGRLLLAREGFPLDIEYIIDLARRNNVVIEINANPHRFDLDWRFCKHAKEKGVLLSINPDAHTTEGIQDVEYGVGIARKGWLERKNILNTFSRDDIRQFFKKRKKTYRI